MNQKGFAPILLVLLVVVVLAVAGGAYYFGTQINSPTTSLTQTKTQNPASSANPIANWKNYTNSKYNYSLSYPAEWFDLENFGAPDTDKYFSNQKVGAPLEMQNGGIWLTVRVSDVKPETNKLFTAKVGVFGSGPKGGTNKISDLTINGIQAAKFTSEPNPGAGTEYSFTTSYYLTKGQKLYALNFLVTDKVVAVQNDKLFDQIAQTFKFTDSTETTSPNAKVLNYKVPAGWQTVQNSSGEFQLSFDPKKYHDAHVDSDGVITMHYFSSVAPTTEAGATSYIISVRPYDGGSRHAFIDKVMNGSKYTWEKTYEKEYLVNGKSSLAIYNADASSTTLLAMLVIDSKRAFFIGGASSDEPSIEELLQTIKVLK